MTVCTLKVKSNLNYSRVQLVVIYLILEENLSYQKGVFFLKKNGGIQEKGNQVRLRQVRPTMLAINFNYKRKHAC